MDRTCLGERVGRLRFCHHVAAVARILDLRAPSPQRAERIEGSAELCADDELSGDVRAAVPRPQALLGKQRSARLPGCLMGQDIRRFRVDGGFAAGRFQQVSG